MEDWTLIQILSLFLYSACACSFLQSVFLWINLGIPVIVWFEGIQKTEVSRVWPCPHLKQTFCTNAPAPCSNVDHASCELPAVVVAVVLEEISDPDLGSVESFGAGIHVGYFNREHFVGFTQVQSPPGTDIVVRVSARAVLPLAVAIPIYGVVRKAIFKQWWLWGLSLDGQVLSCRNNTGNTDFIRSTACNMAKKLPTYS